MNKFTLLTALLISFFTFAQSVTEKNNSLIINDSIEIKQNSFILINKPYEYEFVTIEPMKKGLKLNKLVNVAQLGGIGGTILGSVSRSAKTIQTATKVITTANQVENVLMTAEQINSLNASSKAKKLVGKKFVISYWKSEGSIEGMNYQLFGKIDDKEYKINFLPALSLNEIVLITKQ